MTSTPNKRRVPDQTPGPRLNAPGVYLKIGSFDPAFIRSRRLIGVRRLIEKIRYIYVLTTLHKLYREFFFFLGGRGELFRDYYKSKLLKYPDMQALYTQTRSFVKIVSIVCGKQEDK